MLGVYFNFGFVWVWVVFVGFGFWVLHCLGLFDCYCLCWNCLGLLTLIGTCGYCGFSVYWLLLWLLICVLFAILELLPCVLIYLFGVLNASCWFSFMFDFRFRGYLHVVDFDYLICALIVLVCLFCIVWLLFDCSCLGFLGCLSLSDLMGALLVYGFSGTCGFIGWY